MQNFRFSNGRAEIDERATQDWYAKAEPWDCECANCRNFAAVARKGLLPAPVMQTLGQLEIPPEKATYVFLLNGEGNSASYQFSYRVAGRFFSESAAGQRAEPAYKGRCCHEIYPYGAPGFPDPHFDLEFIETLPWVLEDVLN